MTSYRLTDLEEWEFIRLTSTQHTTTQTIENERVNGVNCDGDGGDVVLSADDRVKVLLLLLGCLLHRLPPPPAAN